MVSRRGMGPYMNHMILAECPGVFLFKIISNLRSLRFFYGCWSPCVVNTAVWRTRRRRTRRQWKMMPEVKSVSWCSKNVLHSTPDIWVELFARCVYIYIYIMCHMHINHICMIYLSLFIINILNHYHVRFLEWHQNGSTQSRRVPCKIVTWAFEAYKVLWCKRTSLRVAPQHQMTQRRSRRCTKCSLELEWMKACISVGLDARLCFFSRRMDMSNMFHATLHFFSCV